MEYQFVAPARGLKVDSEERRKIERRGEKIVKVVLRDGMLCVTTEQRTEVR